MKIILAILLAGSSFGQTLVSLQTGSTAASGTLSNFPLGSFQWAMRFHGLPSSVPGSDLILARFNTGSGNFIVCQIPGGTLKITCFDTSDAGPAGAPTLPLRGATDVRLVMTKAKDSTYGQIRLDMWAGDCTGYQWSNMPSLDQGGQPGTSSQPFTLGGSSIAVAFFRASGFPAAGLGAAPTCPADAPAATAPNMDFRFEGNTLTDVSGRNYTLTGNNLSFVNSPTYNPSSIITGSWTASRPVVPRAPFTLTSASITSSGNGVPSSFAWTQTAGPNATIASPSGSSTLITPSVDGSYTFQLAVTDAAANVGTTTVNVGVVASDANGIKIQTNAELGWIVGPIPRYGTSPWPWFEQTEAMSADTLLGYYQAPPAPGTKFTGSGKNDARFSGRGAFTGALSDTYDVKISAIGTPDSYQWRKNGGSYSASIPITQTFCDGNPLTLTVTDGVIICFDSSTGHTLNDVWTRQAPFAGTASITATGLNHTDAATGSICGGASPPCAGGVHLVGTGTHWLTDITPGNFYWFEWDYASNGSNQGRYFGQVFAVTSDTAMEIYGTAGLWPIPVSLSSAIKIQTVGLDCYTKFTCAGQPGSSLNYYDAGLGIIRLAQATNLDVYTNEAQSWCNLWWQYGLDHGFNIVIPRNAGWQTLMACASMFSQNWWGVQPASGVPGSGLAYNLTYNSVNPGSPVGRDNLPNFWDIREHAFADRAVALMTHAYPAHTGSPSATRATWCGYVTNLTNNLWLNPWVGNGGLLTTINNGQDSYWQDSPFGGGNNIASPIAGFPAGNYTTNVYGTSPWRDSGLATIALSELYNVLNNPSDCANSTLAATVKSTVQKSASFLWDYGRSSDGGLFYNVQNQSDGLSGEPTGNVVHNLLSLYGDTIPPITVSGTTVSLNTAYQPNANIAFTRRFGPCNGTTSIRIDGVNYTVTACPDDYHLTLASGPGNGDYGASRWSNPSTVTVIGGSATVTGSNTGTTRTGFQSMFAPCDGTTFIGILGATGADNGVYKVTACSSQTSLTISPAWSGANQSAQVDYSYSKLALSGASCAPSIGTCEPDFYSGKNLAHDWAVSLGQKFQWTGSATDKSRVEYALGSLYGAAADGPAFLGPNSGPQSSLGPANFDGVIPSCITTQSVQPCTVRPSGDGLRYGLYAKPFGMSAGAGDARNAIAYYLTGGRGGLPEIRNEVLRGVVIR